MYCPNCGTLLDENAKFCADCGATISTDNNTVSASEPAAETLSETPVKPPHKNPFLKTDENNKKKLTPIGICSIIGIAAIIIFAVVLNFTGGKKNYTDVINTYFDAMEEMDGSEIINLMPDELFERKSEDKGDPKKEAAESLKANLINFVGDARAKLKIDKEITDIDIYDQDNVKGYIELLESNHDVHINISEIVRVKVKASYKISLDSIAVNSNSKTETVSLTIGKIKGSWYLLSLY